MAIDTSGPAAPPAATARWLHQLSRTDLAYAGGKAANLGELLRAGFPVPPGFVVGVPAYAAFCDATGLRERIAQRLAAVDFDDTAALEGAAQEVRAMAEREPVPEAVEAAIRKAWRELTRGEDIAVAVRSSVAGEDTASASLTGMNETFLDVSGADAVVDAVRRCWAALFGARTAFYRAKRRFGQADMNIAVVVQRQVSAARAGVMFTVDPASGDRDHLVIEAALGLGESVVSGRVSPDRYVVDKPLLGIVAREVRRKEITIEPGAEGGTVTRALGDEEAVAPVLSDEQVHALAELGRRVEHHYHAPQDCEWALDASDRLWLLQARPITATGHAAPEASAESAQGEVLVRGLGAAPGLAAGCARVVKTREDPATVADGEPIIVDAMDGVVRAGVAQRPRERPPAVATSPFAAATGTRLLLNLSEPSQLERAAALPVDGVGLLRAELMALEALEGVHPRLLLEQGREVEFVERMTEGLTAFASTFAPRTITYRTIDLRSNEFRGLEGGERFEPVEANPMIGYRGALRYTREPEVFRLELDAMNRVWDAGHANLHVMLPFVRTARELERCVRMLAESGLSARRGFELWVMAEVPSMLFNLDRYAALGVAGVSIGSDDLTQLLLGVDRDSELLAETFDERDPAVIAYVRELIASAQRMGLKTSICGQAPSVHPEYADLLVRAGIDAVSVNPDAVDRTRRLIEAAERRVLLDHARHQE